MKFTPLTKEVWLESVKENREFQRFNEAQLSDIYDKMVEESINGMVAANALGGKWEQGIPDYSVLKTLNKKVDNILNATTEELVEVFREVYGEYDKNLRDMLQDASLDLCITPKQIVEALHKCGLSKYASQIYMLFAGMYMGCSNDVQNCIPTANGWVLAYQMADELEVDVSDIDPMKALEYYNNKKR